MTIHRIYPCDRDCETLGQHTPQCEARWKAAKLAEARASREESNARAQQETGEENVPDATVRATRSAT